MKILVAVDVELEDSDERDDSGLTEKAFERLNDAISDAGFTCVDVKKVAQ